MPITDEPLTGGCLCGSVRYAVTGAFDDAGICHCRRCQVRSGQGSSFSARVRGDAVAITAGEDALRAWRPPSGNPKWFCVHCGAHVVAGELGGTTPVVIRVGTLDDAPPITPHWHAWVSSMPSWDVLPDDGIPRYEEGLPSW